MNVLCWPWYQEKQKQPYQGWSLYKFEKSTKRGSGFVVGWVIKYPNANCYHFNYMEICNRNGCGNLVRGTSQSLEEAKETIIQHTKVQIIDDKLINLS